jgi:hypothetical protein
LGPEGRRKQNETAYSGKAHFHRSNPNFTARFPQHREFSV